MAGAGGDGGGVGNGEDMLSAPRCRSASGFWWGAKNLLAADAGIHRISSACPQAGVRCRLTSGRGCGSGAVGFTRPPLPRSMGARLLVPDSLGERSERLPCERERSERLPCEREPPPRRTCSLGFLAACLAATAARSRAWACASSCSIVLEISATSTSAASTAAVEVGAGSHRIISACPQAWMSAPGWGCGSGAVGRPPLPMSASAPEIRRCMSSRRWASRFCLSMYGCMAANTACGSVGVTSSSSISSSLFESSQSRSLSTSVPSRPWVSSVPRSSSNATWFARRTPSSWAPTIIGMSMRVSVAPDVATHPIEVVAVVDLCAGAGCRG